MACAVLLVSMPASADTPQVGYFYGVDMDPIGSASIKTVETEPAVALIFAVDQKTADVTRIFDAWYLNANRPTVTVYAIGVVPEGLSRDVALEALNQRNLHMPVFLSHSDMLLGEDYRLSVLNQDNVVWNSTTPDTAGLYAALKQTGVNVPDNAPDLLAAAASPEPAAPESPSAPEPTETPGTIVTPAQPTPADEPSPSSTPAADSFIAGGKGESGVYINELYGMKVQFPPGWKYQVAGKRDGAVAIPPAGSKMDMRIWTVPAAEITSPQSYIDQRLESIAKKYRTRVHLERRAELDRNGEKSVEVTYSYARPLDPDTPTRGGLVWRGQMLVHLEDGNIKAAAVNAPAGEFMASFPLVTSFIRSFQVMPADNSVAAGYSDQSRI